MTGFVRGATALRGMSSRRCTSRGSAALAATTGERREPWKASGGGGVGGGSAHPTGKKGAKGGGGSDPPLVTCSSLATIGSARRTRNGSGSGSATPRSDLEAHLLFLFSVFLLTPPFPPDRRFPLRASFRALDAPGQVPAGPRGGPRLPHRLLLQAVVRPPHPTLTPPLPHPTPRSAPPAASSPRPHGSTQGRFLRQRAPPPPGGGKVAGPTPRTPHLPPQAKKPFLDHWRLDPWVGGGSVKKVRGMG